MRAMHPDLEELVRAAQAVGAPALQALSPEQARRAYAESRRAIQPAFDHVARVSDAEAPGDDGPIRLRIFASRPGDRASPCLVFFHGGGWMLGNLDTHEGLCRRIAVQAGCCVIAVDYRLAPENPFPAAVDDCVAALRWVAANAAALGVDQDRLAVGGDSAGGNLAAVLALMSRDGTAPGLSYQLLLYPSVDLGIVGGTDEPSDAGLPLTPAMMRFFTESYVTRAEDRADWRASPLHAASLAGAPPAFVLTCGHDPLGVEGQRYADRLQAEGVAVTALHLGDQAHGMLNMGGAIGAMSMTVNYIAAVLRGAWQMDEVSAVMG